MAKKFPYQFEITIEKLLPSGEGLAHYDNWPIFTFGVFPGEKVLVQPAKRRKRSLKAIPLEIQNPSPERRKPRDNHFISTSPFQVMPESLQYEYKKKFAREVFLENAECLPQENPELITGETVWYYRNKMEFSFTRDKDGKLSLALHVRNRKSHYHTVTDCAIAHKKINLTAQKILTILKEKEIPLEALKTLIVRYSYHEDKCLATLYTKTLDFPTFDIYFDDLAGWQIFFSDPKSPASLSTQLLYLKGKDFLIEKIKEVELKYYYDSFFQANPPVFEKLIDYLRENIKKEGDLLELYSGVGAIGLALSNCFNDIVGIESIKTSLEASKENVNHNKIQNASFIEGIAEKQNIIPLLTRANTLLVDPPRSGLHPKIIRRILEAPPKNFIYVSCNINTQAKDFNLLKEKYRVSDWKLFDFYPQTPHLESVLLLERIDH